MILALNIRIIWDYRGFIMWRSFRP